MVRRVPVLVVSALALLAAACGSDRASTDDPVAASSTTTTTLPAHEAPVEVCDPAAVDANELESVADVDVPIGFVRQPAEVLDTGPSDLAKAARDDGSPDGLEALTSLGFLRGYQAHWRNEAAVDLVVYVYEFCQPSGADAYADRSGRAQRAEGAAQFAVDGVEGAIGFSASGTGGAAASVSTSRGRFVLASMVISNRQGFSADAAEDLATSQLAVLVTSAID